MNVMQKYPPFKLRVLIRTLIDDYKVSQSEISRKTGVSQCSLSRLYNRIASVDTTTIGTYLRIVEFAETVMKDVDEK